MTTSFERALAYLEKLPPAVSGSGGHNATFRAACECYRFGLSSSQVFEAMLWFNQNRCQPPWEERELRHKIDDAAKSVRATGSFGQRVGNKLRAHHRGNRPTFQPPSAIRLFAPPVSPEPQSEPTATRSTSEHMAQAELVIAIEDLGDYLKTNNLKVIYAEWLTGERRPWLVVDSIESAGQHAVTPPSPSIRAASVAYEG